MRGLTIRVVVMGRGGEGKFSIRIVVQGCCKLTNRVRCRWGSSKVTIRVVAMREVNSVSRWWWL